VRVLIVEDDPKISSFVAKGLKQAGYAVDQAVDGEQGLELVLAAPFDAAIVDIMLPRLDGLSLIERMRAQGNRTPVLILSARREVDDKVLGFQTGGDDYLTKPFSFAELQARVQALIRRASMTAPASVLKTGDLSLDLARREVRRGEHLIELQPREYSLLEYLMHNAGMVVSKTMILEHVWEYHFDPQTNVVDVLVHRLRSKIDEGFEPKLLHTVRGVGYVLKVP
jgi:DNA-binding response OmpR family regulator